MHPALSVIFFTTLSGAGYGLLALLGAGIALGWWPRDTTATLVPLAVGGVLVSAGLLSSTAHLGRPLRAWRAFSQWRSSWLSREGVASVATYLPLLALGVGAFSAAPGTGWNAAQRIAGALLALGAYVTVFCTARIYSSLRTIPAWHDAHVAPAYLLFAAYTGGLWLWPLGAIWRRGADEFDRLGIAPWLLAGVVLAALAAALVKLLYWRRIDDPAPVAQIGSATGLAAFGEVSAFERPHTEQNYITKEMGFVLARRHAARLRAIALLAGFAAPLACIVAALQWLSLAPAFAALALVFGSVGVFVERWLFFAQARHVVNLYYGARSV
ncbi:MAG TPA: DmsC/YnfH family molybdoenzyme membrane anchor subunit [Tahibacter sp.]|uniref:dimethyl sulfoxide reductase anchor subunit family protein n=1 Tax=Tahibacter sp. TaxID=2056211 RepID=UPI002CBF1E33|nr:DmsC/YnfH family molybdoenzyme membrane anchor subunit [Tahibacter sp.]HSX61429.1 DmsC/YnfH family molybdoenzyme membrane anchor subunit [Tahibacter sp.]